MTILQAELVGSIKGVSLCSVGPKVSHLFFAEDNLLFCQATTQECSTILEILHQYEDASRQKINQGKPNFFSALTPTTTCNKK